MFCTYETQITLNEPATSVSATYTSVDIRCHGENNGNISVTATGGVPPYEYTWNTGDTNVTYIDELYQGSYAVTITDSHGCEYIIDKMEIIEPNELIVSIPQGHSICYNQEAEIWSSVTGGTPPYSYQWNTGATVDSFNVSLTQNTTYSLTVTDSHGCVASSNDCEITINPLLSANISIDKDTICPGDPVTVSITNVNGGDGNYHYTINNTEVYPPFTYYPEQSGIIQVVVSDECNSPHLTLDTSVFVLESPDVAFIADKLSSCPPGEIHFNIPNYVQGYLYTWQFGDGKINISYSQSVSHTYEEAGTYNVTVHVNPGNGCLSNSSLSQMITIYPKPVARFETNPKVIRGIYPEVKFINLSEDADSYYWDFADSTNSTEFEPVHKFNTVKDGYYVTLYAQNKYACSDTARKFLEVQDFFTFWAPTAFSPDNDYINDSFICKGVGIDNSTFSLKIYDRWGEIVFESNDIFQAWDGRIKDGKIGTNGVYTWIASFKDNTGKFHTYSGQVTLIR